jgi:hypothetical protein
VTRSPSRSAKPAPPTVDGATWAFTVDIVAEISTMKLSNRMINGLFLLEIT